MSLDSAIAVVSRWNSTSVNKSYVFSGQRHEIHQYLQAVDEIRRAIDSGIATDRSRAKSAIQTVMLRLADEMRNLLKFNGKTTRNSDSSTYSSTMTDSASNGYEDDYVYGSGLSMEVVVDLRSIAERMNAAGYLGQCMEAYIMERKRSIAACYQKLNNRKLSRNDAHGMEWNTLELIITVWIKSAKICFRKVFAYEKQLCEKIFRDLGDRTEAACFLATVNDCANKSLDMARNISVITMAADRLFRILEAYKTLVDLLPEINKLFNTQSSESLRSNADRIRVDLSRAACKTLEIFEKVLLGADLSRHDMIHGLLKYAMTYVFKLCQSKQAVQALSLLRPPSTSGAGMKLEMVESQAFNKLPFHVIWIITCLVSKLEGEAKSYKKASDANFFLMNSFHYIVKIINANVDVKEIVGGDYFEAISRKLDEAKAEYLRLTFAKVLSILGDRRSLPEKLKRFNAELEKLRTNLTELSVEDFQLLQDLRASMEKILVPVYTSFLGQLSSSSLSLNDVKFPADKFRSTMQDFFGKTQSWR